MASPPSSTSDPEKRPLDVNGEANTLAKDVATEPLTGVTSDVGAGTLNGEQATKNGPSLQSSTSEESSTHDGVANEAKVTQADQENKKKWYKRLNPLKRHVPSIPEERIVSREYNASFLSHVTFQWMAPLMDVGYKRPLESTDIWLVNPERSTEILTTRLQDSFKKRVEAGSKRPLVGALYDTFKVEFIIGGVCQLIATLVQCLSPFVLRFLISFAGEAYIAQRTGRPAPHIGRGIGLVIGVTAMQVIQSLCNNHFMYKGMMVGGQSRAVLIAAIFDKAMKLSGRAKAGGQAIDAKPEVPPAGVQPGSEEEKKWYKKMLKKKQKTEKKSKGKADVSGDGQGWSNGRIVNLMSTDTYRVDLASGFFHLLWASPISILITLILLLVNITYSALAGFAILVLVFPLLGKAVKYLFQRRVKINKITDQRVSLTQEILQAVRFVKFFGWESSFLERLGGIRKREIHSIQVVLRLRNAILAIGMSMPVFASMLAFITYSLTDHSLNPARIFSSLALFNSLRLPLNLLPLVIGQVTDALSSLGRIEEFLLAEEAQEDVKWDAENRDAIILNHADFTWERTATQEAETGPGKPAKKDKHTAEKPEKPSGTSDEPEVEPFKLQDMDFAIGRNELIAVIGSVGSGKSSLLAALAGDMRKTDGGVVLGASRAFCPQYAWIQNATVKENIMFGKDFDYQWYNSVVDACALRPDFDMLPNGDLTEIGERGITVSGGQKQRLNIARAIYFNADIVLLDDPLSAVDAHVGRHIMDNAICGLLKDKCRILATHQLHVLNRCDRIIWMHEGRIQTIDTYDNLMHNNEEFIKLMSTTAVEEVETESVEKEEEEELKLEIQRSGGKKPAAALMQTEERAVNGVSWGVYLAYIRSAGTIFSMPIIILILILAQGANISTSLWLSWWTANKFGYSQGVYIGVYAALGFMQAVLMFSFSDLLSFFGTQAGKHMLHLAMSRVLRAPMSFFDTTPLGRITNRFSKDIDAMDNTLTDSIRMYFLTMAMIIAVFILIIVYFHYFAIALGPLFVLFIFSAAYYRSSAREVKRHESVLRSSMFAQFSEAVHGTPTIRAYGLQGRFSKSVRAAIDDMNSAYFLTFANQRWLSMRLDVVSTLLVFTTGILVVTSRFNVSPSTSGLVLSYILSIAQMLQFTVRQFAEVENNMNATERIHYYGTQLEEEAPEHLGDVPPSWPDKGEIIFDDVKMRYRDGLPLVLKGFTMHVKAGERIGVVGRTGAGKSSIMGTLFRLVELSGGSITIDGLDISRIGLSDLRSKLSIIPQDPALFRGTIRSNLDPFSQHTDLELWSALRQADLVHDDPANSHDSSSTATPNPEGGVTDGVPGSPGVTKAASRIHLDSVVEEEGLNFSLGQRQLMALARALVRGSQIIVCDEATSSVDMETDQKIQKTIREGFRGKTLLCIAHRLKTIINYDRICVMDKGQIAELDSPLALWEKDGIFRGMCERSGIRREDFFETNE